MVGIRLRTVCLGASVAALALVGCGTTSVADFEQQLWDSIKEEIPTAAKPDCPADAKVEDGQSFTCEIQITEVSVDPANPAKPAAPKAQFREVEVAIEGDEFRWEITK